MITLLRGQIQGCLKHAVGFFREPQRKDHDDAGGKQEERVGLRRNQ